MISTPPRPDESDEPLEAGWAVEGSAGRSGISADEVDRASRTYWEAEADAYQTEHGAFLSGDAFTVVDSVDSIDRSDYLHAGGGPSAFVWGPEGLTEAEAGLLGPVDELVGARVLEVGCGAAQCARWLAHRGVHAVGIDISIAQLRHALPRLTQPLPSAPPRPTGSRRVSADRVPSDPTGSLMGPSNPDAIVSSRSGGATENGRLDVLVATATALPFIDASFDGAFASYGAIQFVGDLPRLLGEVRRVLRPGGRWLFSVTHPIRWAFPDDPGPAGLKVSGSYFDRTPYVEREGSGGAVYAEFHRTIGDYVGALVGAGFAIERIIEPEWPDWNKATWGGWSPVRGKHLPGTLIIGCRADAGAGARPPD